MTSWALRLEQALVGVALDVGGHRRPVLLADQLDDELAQLRRVLDLVLGLLEDQPEHAALLAQLAQRLAVVLLQLDPLHLRRREVGPAVALRDRLLLAGELGALVGHLEEEQEGELLQVVLVGEPVVAQDVAVGPELLDDAVGGVGHGLDALALRRRRLLGRHLTTLARHGFSQQERNRRLVGRVLIHKPAFEGPLENGLAETVESPQVGREGALTCDHHGEQPCALVGDHGLLGTRRQRNGRWFDIASGNSSLPGSGSGTALNEPPACTRVAASSR